MPILDGSQQLKDAHLWMGAKLLKDAHFGDGIHTDSRQKKMLIDS